MLLTIIPVLCSSLYVGYGISLDSADEASHVLVNFLCLVLVELDIVFFMSTPLTEATVFLESPRSFASVVCVWGYLAGGRL